MRNLKSLFLIIGFNLLIHFVRAQTDTLRYAKIKLNSGVSIKGYVLDEVSPEHLVVKTDYETSFMISMDEIKKMKFGDIKYVDKQQNQSKSISTDQVYDNHLGFYHLFGLGWSIGEDNTNLSLSTENGYRFNEHLAVGLGMNYDRYSPLSALPIYVNARGYLHNRKVSPFYYAGAGYGFAWANEERAEGLDFEQVNGGFMAHTGLGYQINFSGSAMIFHLGYKILNTKMEYSTYGYYHLDPLSSFMPANQGGNVEVTEKRVIRRAEIKAAFLF